MSAVAQDLYPVVPVPLSPEFPAEPDPSTALAAKPEAPAFVLSCSGVPSEPQRTHGLKISPQESAERRDSASRESCPAVMDFVSEAPAGIGKFVKDGETQNSSSVKLDTFQSGLRDVLVAKGRKDLAKQQFMQHPLTSGGKSSWLEEKESPLISSPSCLEWKGAWQNPEENQAKVQVATEKQSDLKKDAQGMEADGTRLYGKTGEPRTRVSTGVPPEGSQCSGADTVTAKAAVVGSDSLVSVEPISHATPKEEEERGTVLSAGPRQAWEEKLPKQNEERDAVSGNSSVQLDRFALPLEGRSAIDACPSGSSFEASSYAFQDSSKFGHRPRDVSRNLLEVNSHVPEGFAFREEEVLKSNWSSAEVELQGERDFEPDAVEAFSQSGKIEDKLPGEDDEEQKQNDASARGFIFVHQGTVETQKGSALHNCWKEDGDFHLKRGRFWTPTEQLTTSVNMPSEIGIRDVACALFEKPLEGASRADSIQQDPFCFLSQGRLTVMAIENWTLSLKGNDFLCLQDNCARPRSSNHSFLQVESCGLAKCRALARVVCASRYSRGVGISVLADKGRLQMHPLWEEFLFPQQADPCLGWRGSTDILPPSKVTAMLRISRLLRPKKVFASSQKSSSCAATKDETRERESPMPRGRKPNAEPPSSRTSCSSNPDPWHGNGQLHPETAGGVPATVLGNGPAAPRQNATGEDTFRNKESALADSPLKAEPLNWQDASMLLGYAFPSDWLMPNCLGAKDDGLRSVCELVVKSPPGKFSFKNRSLFVSSSPYQPFLQPVPLPCASLKGQKRMEQIYVKLSEGREIPDLTCAGCSSRPAQDQTICLSQKCEALISSSLKAYSSPLITEHFPKTGGVAQGTNRHLSFLALEVANASTSLRQDVLISSYSEQNLGDAEGEGGLTADATELPFPIFSNSKEALEALLENLIFPVRSRKVTFSFQDAQRTQHPPICLSEDILKFDTSEARDSIKLTVLQWHAVKASYALQTKHLSCRRTAAETIGSAMRLPSLKEETLATFSQCLRGTESRLLEAESRQGLLEGHLVDQGLRAPLEEGRAQLSLQKEAERKPAAPCGSLSRERGGRAKPEAKSPLKRRRCGDGQPPGCVAQGGAASREDPQLRPVAPAGPVGQRSEEGPPSHTAREFKRPKRGEGEPLCFGRCRRQANRRNATAAAALCALPRGEGWHQRGGPGAFGPSCRVRGLLPSLWKGSAGACSQVSALNQFRASEIVPGSPFLRNLTEMVPKQKCTRRDPARKPAASRNHKALPWDRPTKRQSCLGVSAWPHHELCLRTLSALADKLLAPVRSPQKRKPLSRSSELLPSAEKCSRWRNKKLLEIVSFACLKLSSNPWLPRGSRSIKTAGSRPSAESRVLCCFELRSPNPSAFRSPIFPGSVHLSMDARLPRKLPERQPLCTVPRLAWEGPPPSPVSEERLSFCLSQSCPTAQGAAGIPPELRAPLSSEGRGAVAQNARCPARSLRTAFALFPHGCCHLWTRRQSLSSRISTVPKVTLLQFARGLQGLKRATWVSADLFSSLRCSLGRGLSVRNQHGGPSAGPSECRPLRSNPCLGQPASPASASVGHGNSSAKPPPVPDPLSDPSWAGNDDDLRLEPFVSASLATSCSDPGPGPAQSPLGLPAPGSEDKPDAPGRKSPSAEAQLEHAESEKRPKKVSQIRIRKTIPKPDPNLTPMGLPRQKRSKKTEFSLEEIYTNKNYKSPPATRCLETIFEEPKEKNGSFISVSQQKRKRILEFQDFTVPRKRKARSRAKGTGSATRAQKAAVGGRELDVLLVQKLSDLETFFAKEEKQEPTAGS